MLSLTNALTAIAPLGVEPAQPQLLLLSSGGVQSATSAPSYAPVPITTLSAEWPAVGVTATASDSPRVTAISGDKLKASLSVEFESAFASDSATTSLVVSLRTSSLAVCPLP